MQNRKITMLAIGQVLRIACVVLYYMLLVVLGLVVICGSFCAAISLAEYIIDFLISDDFSPGSVMYAISCSLIVIGLLLVALMLGLYLIKPLFAFKRDRDICRVEITEKEAPELFSIIREIARQTGNKMPRTVCLSPRVNAAVFYDTSFWNIFLPIRRNLEIGLGLFDGMSVEELKSIIAHEFGHFSQNSAKVGYAVFVVQRVLYDLTYAEDFWDRLMAKWVESPIPCSKIAIVLTNLVRRLNHRIFRFVEKGNMKLSRQMEYDADNVACQCVGSEVCRSALCKSPVLSELTEISDGILMKDVVSDGKAVDDYFAAKEVTCSSIPYEELLGVTPEQPMLQPRYLYNVESRVKVEDVWQSHPSLEERLKNIDDQAAANVYSGAPVPSWSLIPEQLRDSVSRYLASIISSNAGEQVKIISLDEYKEWISDKNKECALFWFGNLRFFFSNRITSFDVDEEVEAPSESPFTEDNARKIVEFNSLCADYDTLCRVASGEIEAKRVQYQGVVYEYTNLLIEELKKECYALRDEVVKIYAQIYAYLRSKISEEERTTLRNVFLSTFKSIELKGDVQWLYEHRARLVNELNKYGNSSDSDEYYQLCRDIVQYEKQLRLTIISILGARTPNMPENDLVRSLQDYVKGPNYNTLATLDASPINTMFAIVDYLPGELNATSHAGRSFLHNVAKEVVKNEKSESNEIIQ